MSVEESRNRLVDGLLVNGCIRSAAVESAFREVPRHLFAPQVEPEAAYRDEVIPIEVPGKERASSLSQPAIVAEMLEQLGLQPGHRVLEIGAGSGYNAALMAHMVGEESRVVTVEIEQALVRRAREHLATAGFRRVEVIHGDGGLGYPEKSPYDRIVLTAGTPDIAPVWREQLRPEGRLVLPLELWPGLQVCVALEPARGSAGEHLKSVAARWCGFVSLRGGFAGPEPIPEDFEDEYPSEKSAPEQKLRALREVSLASGLSFPEGLRISVYPQGSNYSPSPQESVVEKEYSTLVLDWR